MNIHNILSLGGSTAGGARHDVKREAHDTPSSNVLRVSLAHTWTGVSLVMYDSNAALHCFSLVKGADIGEKQKGWILVE